MSPQVDAILQQIERLNEDDRIILEQKLQEMIDVQWQRQAESARTEARQRGIEQRTIDDAVEEIRYGS
jgi:hypothetical protein